MERETYMTRIEYFWNDDEIGYEIDLINHKDVVVKQDFQMTKMWAEKYIENLKDQIREKCNKDIPIFFKEESTT